MTHLLLMGLLCMMIISVSSGTVYVQSGSDITDCHMKCPKDDVTVELYRKCGGEDRTLLENLCSFNAMKPHDPRLQLDRDSGCWKLTPARKDDSCVYKIWCYDIPEYLIYSTEIRVLGLLCMMIISVSSGTVYVQSGSDITDCNMKCPLKEGKMELYRKCGEKEETMIEYFPHYKYANYHDSRIRLHTGSGCWKLTPARKGDSCVYETWCYIYSDKDYLLSSTEIRVLDPVLISNITSNCSQLGEEVAVRVHFSGEESAVTWEVDGEPLPEIYRLIDDNRTLIIPSVQRDDAERRFRVRITNPVSDITREYRLTNETMFIRMLETEDGRHRGVTAAILVVAVLIIIMGIIYMTRRKCSRNRIPETQKDVLYSSVPQHNGSVPAVTERNEPEAILIQN